MRRVEKGEIKHLLKDDTKEILLLFLLVDSIFKSLMLNQDTLFIQWECSEEGGASFHVKLIKWMINKKQEMKNDAI
jgi:hypothetical protein